MFHCQPYFLLFGAFCLTLKYTILPASIKNPENMSDKFSLKWNDYQSNWNKALNELRKDTEFTDVMLISDDKVKVSAHKILLSSCSNLLKFILRSNTQTNPLLYLGGVNSINLGFIL